MRPVYRTIVLSNIVSFAETRFFRKNGSLHYRPIFKKPGFFGYREALLPTGTSPRSTPRRGVKGERGCSKVLKAGFLNCSQGIPMPWRCRRSCKGGIGMPHLHFAPRTGLAYLKPQLQHNIQSRRLRTWKRIFSRERSKRTYLSKKGKR